MFYDDVLLRTPAGVTVEAAYDSTLLGLNVLPREWAEGYLFFENLECDPGRYEVIISDYRSVYLEEVFTLP
jgi:hypothetical protein